MISTINNNSITTTILVVYLIMCTIWFFKEGIHVMIIATTLSKYLKKYRYELWRNLTSIGHVGPGASNPFRFFKWLYGTKHIDDEKLLRLTDSLKIRLRYMFFLFLGVISGIILNTIAFS